MELILPSWFKQRQAKAESAGENLYRLTGPNLPESFISIRQENGLWAASLKKTADGPDTDTTGPVYDNVTDAWGAAFELFRVHLVV